MKPVVASAVPPPLPTGGSSLPVIRARSTVLERSKFSLRGLLMPAEATKTEVGSYFISNYPPYSQWKVEFLPEVERALQEPPRDVPLGLYLHIPFCRKRCKFC